MAYSTKSKQTIATRKYRQAHPEQIKAYKKIYNAQVRQKFLELYGAYCHCEGCNITEEAFLTIEHVKGQVGVPKNKKERGADAYAKAIRTCPNDDYTVLCYNCNQVKKLGARCPHNK
jgi:hypothetical protein